MGGCLEKCNCYRGWGGEVFENILPNTLTVIGHVLTRVPKKLKSGEIVQFFHIYCFLVDFHGLLNNNTVKVDNIFLHSVITSDFGKIYDNLIISK